MKNITLILFLIICFQSFSQSEKVKQTKLSLSLHTGVGGTSKLGRKLLFEKINVYQPSPQVVFAGRCLSLNFDVLYPLGKDYGVIGFISPIRYHGNLSQNQVRMEDQYYMDESYTTEQNTKDLFTYLYKYNYSLGAYYNFSLNPKYRYELFMNLGVSTTSYRNINFTMNHLNEETGNLDEYEREIRFESDGKIKFSPVFGGRFKLYPTKQFSPILSARYYFRSKDDVLVNLKDTADPKGWNYEVVYPSLKQEFNTSTLQFMIGVEYNFR